MAYLTVTTQFDVVDPGDGQLSLREAVAQAKGTPDTIVFAANLEGMILTLTGGQLTVDQDLKIDGDKDNNGSAVTVDGNESSQILRIMGDGIEAELRDLTLSHGSTAGFGGAIEIGEGANLTLDGCTIYGNSANAGGAIFARNISTQVLINNSSITNNTAYAGGGGLWAQSNAKFIVRNSNVSENIVERGGGGGISIQGASLIIENSNISGNIVGQFGGSNIAGGGISLVESISSIDRSTISNNTSNSGGGIAFGHGALSISNSTIANNLSSYNTGDSIGGAILASAGEKPAMLTINNSTITGNRVSAGEYAYGGGIGIPTGTRNIKMNISNSILSGNFADITPDIAGTITFSNGHNVFGSDVVGNIPGDRESVSPATLFATVDLSTGGGKLGPDGTVTLKNNVANPALSAGDPLAASAFDQRGTARPLPAGSLPDLGAVELKQPLSTGATANNDVRSGTNAANNLTGLAGNDYLKGLGSNDTMDGGPGGDLLDGGPGNDKLTGGTGIDLVAYPGTAAVVIDLSGTADTAKRGSEKDTLIGIEGALGSGGNDTFKGDALNNAFQGKAGKDIMTGGGGRDTWDFNDVADSPAGAGRDVVTDFAPGQDVVDLAGIDADSAVPGNQSFRWVGAVTLTGAAQLGYFVGGGNTIMRASTDADAATEIEIQLTGAKVLTESDFRP